MVISQFCAKTIREDSGKRWVTEKRRHLISDLVIGRMSPDNLRGHEKAVVSPFSTQKSFAVEFGLELTLLISNKLVEKW